MLAITFLAEVDYGGEQLDPRVCYANATMMCTCSDVMNQYTLPVGKVSHLDKLLIKFIILPNTRACIGLLLSAHPPILTKFQPKCPGRLDGCLR